MTTADATIELTEAPARWRANGWALFVLPAVIVLVAVFLLPIARLFANSFHPHKTLGQVGDRLTFENYARFIFDPFYLSILFNTFWLGFTVVTACLVLGYPVAYVLARMRSRWRGFLIFFVVAPLLISTVIRNLGWFPILGGSGLVNWILEGLGVIDEPLKLANNFTGVAIALTHALLPFMILALMTVIQRIEPEIEEAAINLGASPVETFFRVVLRLSRPGLLAGYLLVFTMAISAFTTPAMMGGKRVLVMATFIEQQMRTVLNYAFGSTAAVVLMVVAAALTLTAVRGGAEEA